MDRKTLIYYSLIGFVGVAVVVGVVIFLRAQNAPSESMFDQLQTAPKTTSTAPKNGGVAAKVSDKKIRKFTPMDKIPKASSYSGGAYKVPGSEAGASVKVGIDGKLIN